MEHDLVPESQCRSLLTHSRRGLFLFCPTFTILIPPTISDLGHILADGDQPGAQLRRLFRQPDQTVRSYPLHRTVAPGHDARLGCHPERFAVAEQTVAQTVGRVHPGNSAECDRCLPAAESGTEATAETADCELLERVGSVELAGGGDRCDIGYPNQEAGFNQ